MVKKKILSFGATGQIGRHLIRKLTKNNYKVICQTRNLHKAIFLKTSGSIGYIEIKESKIFDYEKVNGLVDTADIAINLIGILFESGKINTFEKIHTLFPKLLSEICKKKNKHLIHISSLGVENAPESKYAVSKTEGENKILEADGLLATCIQHEMDHLEGILFIDYLSKLKKTMIVKKLSKRKNPPDRIIV